MGSERRQRVLALLGRDQAPAIPTKRLCEVCAEVTGLSGAGVMLMSGDVPRASLCTSDPVSARIEALQFALGEGPCIDAYHQDRPVLEPDLVDPRERRWFAFTGPAVDVGVRAVFGFPVRVGAARLGVLHFYRDRPGRLTDDQHADALVLSDVVARAVLTVQAGAPLGTLAEALETGSDFHTVVHQATGMVAAQLEVSVGDALIRLKAHAFGNERPLAAVAADVVARRLRFDADSGELDRAP